VIGFDVGYRPESLMSDSRWAINVMAHFRLDRHCSGPLSIRQAVVCQLFRVVKLAAVDRSAISDILDG
jgi:hypothetical protein